MIDRLALVTGGSKGLGLELCIQLQARGVHVIDLSRSAPHPHSIALDLARPTACADAVHGALRDADLTSLQEFIFIGNAAAIDPIGPVHRLSPGAIEASLHVNIVSAIGMFSAVAACLQDAPGRKVLAHITSGAAINPHAGLSLYGAAKAGMEQFICALALEQADQVHPFIPVSIDPGALDTAMQATLRAASPAEYPQVQRFIDRHQAGALAAPSDAAAAVIGILFASTLTPGARYHVKDFRA